MEIGRVGNWGLPVRLERMQHVVSGPRGRHG